MPRCEGNKKFARTEADAKGTKYESRERELYPNTRWWKKGKVQDAQVTIEGVFSN